MVMFFLSLVHVFFWYMNYVHTPNTTNLHTHITLLLINGYNQNVLRMSNMYALEINVIWPTGHGNFTVG